MADFVRLDSIDKVASTLNVSLHFDRGLPLTDSRILQIATKQHKLKMVHTTSKVQPCPTWRV